MNESKLERFDIYQRAASQFICQVLAQETSDDLQKLMDAIAAQWDVRILTPRTDDFLTSDHPTLLFARENEDLSFAILPISPTMALCIHRRNSLEIVDTSISERDLGILNGIQCKHSIAAVFSFEVLSSEAKDAAVKWMGKRKVGASRLSDGLFVFSTMLFENGAFEFIREAG